MQMSWIEKNESECKVKDVFSVIHIVTTDMFEFHIPKSY